MSMRPRVALATYERMPSLAADDRLLLDALNHAGVDAEPAVWSNDEVIWETFDAVIVRSCWDYHLRIVEFRSWLERLDASRIPTWNSPELVLWNSDKRYLLDLAHRGVATIPTVLIARGGGARAVQSVVDTNGWTRFVLKPSISASGFETYALELRPGSMLDQASRETIERATSVGDMLVQPFADEVPRNGELSYIFIDGAFSHATIKRAASGDFRVQTEHGGRVDAIEPVAIVVDQAAQMLALLPEVPLYARVDGIMRDSKFLLMELELIEPNLFLGFSAGAAERLAQAIRSRVAQS